MSTREAAERLRDQRGNYYLDDLGPLKNDLPKFLDDLKIVARDYLRLTDETPVDEAWLRAIGFKDWDRSDGDEYELWHPANDELGWKCRIAWIANGFYLARMSPDDDDESEYDGPSESVELFDSRNTTKKVTRGQVRGLFFALNIPLNESEKE